jgi:hypothetical protein
MNMKKKLVLIILSCIVSLGLFAGCGSSGSAEAVNNPYYVLFEKLYSEDSGLNSNIKYIAVDLSAVQTEDNGDFLTLMQAFCEQEGLTLLEDTIDGLTEKGLIKDLYFEEGIVISFEDTLREDTKLVTKGMKWRSGLGAIGGEFTLEIKDGAWTITEEGPRWIS